MIMTNAEIVADYRAAKNKAKQVEILADLNLCKQKDIIEVLTAEGLSYKELPRAPRKPKTIGEIVADTIKQHETVENTTTSVEVSFPASRKAQKEERMNAAHSVENVVIEREEAAAEAKTFKPGQEFYEMVARMWSAYLTGITGEETTLTAENVRVMNGVAVLMKK